MFNLQGSEIIFILLIALVVLGPEKLPGAIRRAMRTYQELRKMGDGFQSEFKNAIDEPLREMKETAGLIRDQADPKKIAEEAEKAAHAEADARKEAQRKKTVADMHAAGAAALADETDPTGSNGTAPDEWDDPIDDAQPLPPPAEWASPAGASTAALAPPAPSSSTAPPGLPADPTVPSSSAANEDHDENAA